MRFVVRTSQVVASSGPSAFGRDECDVGTRWSRVVRVAGRGLAIAVMCATVSLFTVSAASAETLHDALSAAYRSNPSLRAEQARLRATDEEIARAKSGYRPTINADGDVTTQWSETDPDSLTDGTVTQKSFTLSLDQPVFTGFRTFNAVQAAEASVRSSRENLRDFEQALLLDAVTVYSDVIRDRAVMRLRENNLKVLQNDFQATEARFSVGELTSADLEQARARAAGARSALELARANLAQSRAVYRQVIGHRPGRLANPPAATRRIPNSLNDAIEVGLGENPRITRAIFQEQAARFQVDQIYGEYLPQISVNAQYSRTLDPTVITDDSQTGTISGRVRVPLYQAGDVSARVRQAHEEADGRFLDVEQQRNLVRADVVGSWSRLRASQAQLTSDQVQVRANDRALSSVRAEEQVGQRTLLDVLNAEQELLDAQVALATTQRDVVVASYQLLSSLGRLSAVDIGLGTALHDPQEYTDLVRDKYWGTSVDHAYEHSPPPDLESFFGGAWAVEVESYKP